MSINVSCPACRLAFRVPDHLAGRRVRCTDCGDPVRVAGTVRAEAPDRPVMPSHRSALLIAGFGLLAILTAVAVALLIFIVSDEPPDAPKKGQPVAVVAPAMGILRAQVQPGLIQDLITLSNPRQVRGFAGRTSYKVDYAFKPGSRPQDAAFLFLVVRSQTGSSTLQLRGLDRDNAGTISFDDVFRRLSAPLEIHVEQGNGFRLLGRVSNVVTLAPADAK